MLKIIQIMGNTTVIWTDPHKVNEIALYLWFVQFKIIPESKFKT